MATIKYNTVSSEVTILSTELDGLAGNTLSSAGTEVTDANNEMYANIKLVLNTQTTRDAGAATYLWLLPESDGDYNDTAEDCLGLPTVIFTLDAAVDARTIVKSNIQLPNSNFKPIAKNSTGQAFNSSGNFVELEYYSIQSN